MCDENTLNLLENKFSDCRMVLYDVQTLVKFGALASDSAIIDKELQLKVSEDYYLLLKNINKKIQDALILLDS